MSFAVLLFAIAMPVVAWFSQRGAFGPDNGTISDRYPTLIVAAGYAFSIWGLIFLLDLVFGAWQLSRHADRVAIRRIRPVIAVGFALTASWMIVFSQQWFVGALAIIWVSLACLLYCTLMLSRDTSSPPAQTWCAWLALSLHAGWLSLAAFLNTAQVIVAFRLLPVDRMLSWSLPLLAIAAALLLIFNQKCRGNLAYVAAALWGLVAVAVKQSTNPTEGAQASAWAALLVAAVLVVQTLSLAWRQRKARGVSRRPAAG